MLIGTAAAYDIPGTLVVSILVAAVISSAGVRTRNENSNDTYPNRKLHNPCVLVYKLQILTAAVQQYQVYAMLVRDRTWCILVRTCIACRLPAAECAGGDFDGRFDTPGHF